MYEIELFNITILIAQLEEHQSFVPEDLGSNPAQGKIFFFSCFFYIFEKIRVSTSFFEASEALESNKKLVNQILSILGGH